MKKLLSLCLCALMAVSFASCSSGNDNGVSALPETKTSEPEQTEEKSTAIDPNTIDVDTVENTFNEDGAPLIAAFRDSDGNLTAFTIYEYDENGAKLRTTSYHADRTVFEKVEYEYFEGGYYETSILFDSTGKEIGREKTEYDASGKKVENK